MMVAELALDEVFREMPTLALWIAISRLFRFEQYGLHRKARGIRAIFSCQRFRQRLDYLLRLDPATLSDFLDDRIQAHVRRLAHPGATGPSGPAGIGKVRGNFRNVQKQQNPKNDVVFLY